MKEEPQETVEVPVTKVEETEDTSVEITEKPKEAVVLQEKPKKDFSTTIANAKQFVYTIYSDVEQGSGFLYNSSGDILTNAHVLKDASYVTVKNSNGQEFDGQIIGISETQDIALVRVLELADKQPPPMEMSQVGVGTEVFSLGSPGNIANTSSEGVITSVGKTIVDDFTYANLYEMNALIKQGSSGGPLINASTGKVLGINSIVLTDNPQIGYAIPIYTVSKQLNDWVANPLIPPDPEKEILQHVDDAYLDEELLASFIVDYYELFLFGLNDVTSKYYISFLYPGSQAETDEQKKMEELRKLQQAYSNVKTVVNSVLVSEDSAVIDADATFTYTDSQDKQTKTVIRKATFTVVLDQYGDYQIKEVIVK